MAKLRMSLPATLLLGVIMVVGVGSAAAQEGTAPGGLSTEYLQNGVWLEWTKGKNLGRVTHQDVSVESTTDAAFSITQKEKTNADHAFIPYDDFTGGTGYTIAVLAKRDKQTLATGAAVSITLPAADARASLPPKPARKHTHPSGLTVTPVTEVNDVGFQENYFEFAWTGGISPRYKIHQIVCRQVGLQPWFLKLAYPGYVDPVETVERYTTRIHRSTFSGISRFTDGAETICRIATYTHSNKQGPVTNNVKFTY